MDFGTGMPSKTRRAVTAPSQMTYERTAMSTDRTGGRTAAAHPCMSRHLDNAGKPRPPVEWTVTYECANGHALDAVECCDGCAASLVDGRQRCARCFRTMVVTALEPAP